MKKELEDQRSNFMLFYLDVCSLICTFAADNS